MQPEVATQWLPWLQGSQRDGGYEKYINIIIMQPEVAAEWLPWLQGSKRDGGPLTLIADQERLIA